MRRIIWIIVAILVVVLLIVLFMNYRNRNNETAVDETGTVTETVDTQAGGGIGDPTDSTASVPTDKTGETGTETDPSSEVGSDTTPVEGNTDSSTTNDPATDNTSPSGETNTETSTGDASATDTDGSSESGDSAATSGETTDGSKDSTNPSTDSGDAGNSGAATEPDSDGDGVVDSADKCPNNFGTQADGCGQAAPANTVPIGTGDSDGDGVADQSDDCPLHWGDQANGCPSAYMGGIPVFRVCTVAANQNVTVQTYNLTPNQTFTAYMIPLNSPYAGTTAGIPVSQFDSGVGGTQRLTFEIPAELANTYQISLRISTSHMYPYYAYNWFYNNTTNWDYCQ